MSEYVQYFNTSTYVSSKYVNVNKKILTMRVCTVPVICFFWDTTFLG
jgi:hypothetical protein